MCARHVLAFTGKRIATVPSKPLSFSSDGKWSSVPTSKWGWLWAFSGGQRGLANGKAGRIYFPLVRAPSGGWTPGWSDTVRNCFPRSGRYVIFTPFHKSSLHSLRQFGLPLTQTLLTRTGDLFLQEGIPHPSNQDWADGKQKCVRTLQISWTKVKDRFRKSHVFWIQLYWGFRYKKS